MKKYYIKRKSIIDDNNMMSDYGKKNWNDQYWVLYLKLNKYGLHGRAIRVCAMFYKCGIFIISIIVFSH